MSQLPDAAVARAAKLQLRHAMKARRSALPEAVRVAGAAIIAGHGLAFLEARTACTVSAFLAIGDELDAGPLLARLAADGHPVCLPVMQGKTRPLQFRRWSPGDPLRTVQWGIREPAEAAPVVEPDVLLVPLLAFDRGGHRLGYGGGYYDRTLRALRSRRPVTAVGLAFAEQEVDAVPHLDYDERLDWVLTPLGAIRCNV